MIHYHGTPITPRTELLKMSGRHFCVSYAAANQVRDCVTIGQSVMFDNGAFSTFTRGHEFDLYGYCAWLENILGHPHWAVAPDVIGEGVKEQRAMLARWPYPKELSAPVWHLALPIDYLLELADNYPKICLGSSAQFWKVGSPAWCGRMDEAFNALCKRRFLPWIHGLRMLNLGGTEYPLASADSVNVGRNFKDAGADPEQMAGAIDSRNNPVRWQARPIQASLT